MQHIKDTYANRYDPDGARLFAAFYWRTLLVAAFLIVVSFITYGEWNLFHILTDLDNTPQSSLPPPALNTDQLDSDVSLFAARQSAYQALQTHPGSLADPSR